MVTERQLNGHLMVMQQSLDGHSIVTRWSLTARAMPSAPADGPPAAALKRRLLQAVAGTGMGRVEGGDLAREVDELVAALGAAQEDFDVATADGPWQLLFTRNGNKAPKVFTEGRKGG